MKNKKIVSLLLASVMLIVSSGIVSVYASTALNYTEDFTSYNASNSAFVSESSVTTAVNGTAQTFATNDTGSWKLSGTNIGITNLPTAQAFADKFVIKSTGSQQNPATAYFEPADTFTQITSASAKISGGDWHGIRALVSADEKSYIEIVRTSSAGKMSVVIDGDEKWYGQVTGKSWDMTDGWTFSVENVDYTNNKFTMRVRSSSNVANNEDGWYLTFGQSGNGTLNSGIQYSDVFYSLVSKAKYPIGLAVRTGDFNVSGASFTAATANGTVNFAESFGARKAVSGTAQTFARNDTGSWQLSGVNVGKTSNTASAVVSDSGFVITNPEGSSSLPATANFKLNDTSLNKFTSASATLSGSAANGMFALINNDEDSYIWILRTNNNYKIAVVIDGKEEAYKNLNLSAQTDMNTACTYTISNIDYNTKDFDYSITNGKTTLASGKFSTMLSSKGNISAELNTTQTLTGSVREKIFDALVSNAYYPIATYQRENSITVTGASFTADKTPFITGAAKGTEVKKSDEKIGYVWTLDIANFDNAYTYGLEFWDTDKEKTADGATKSATLNFGGTIESSGNVLIDIILKTTKNVMLNATVNK